MHPVPGASRDKILSVVRQVMSESTKEGKIRSVIDYCKLPPVQFPPGFKAPKYQKYDGTTFPHHHLSGFVMDSHTFLYDKALLVHLFQKSLDGEALNWFSSLSMADLASFDIVVERFTSYFSHMTHQRPTVYDLVSEKMKPDEDFTLFANRWRTMASKSEVLIPEAQAVTMMVSNTTPQLKAVLMLSELNTYTQLYNRAKIVQAQIKESTLPVFFEPKPRGRKPPPVPTTEGVTLNEQVTALQNPPRPDTRQIPSHVQQQPQQYQ